MGKMNVWATPWARESLTAEEKAALHDALPPDYRIDLRRSWRSHQYTALLYFRRQCIAGGASWDSAFQAAVAAIGQAAGDIDEDALRRQLNASLVAIGVEPVEGAA